MNRVYMYRMYHVLFKNAIENRIGYFISSVNDYYNDYGNEGAG